MTDLVNSAEVRVGPQGRLVIPASLRRSLRINAGDRLIARSDGERLILERPEAVRARIRQRFRVVPPEVSLADDRGSTSRRSFRKPSLVQSMSKDSGPTWKPLVWLFDHSPPRMPSSRPAFGHRRGR